MRDWTGHRRCWSRGVRLVDLLLVRRRNLSDGRMATSVLKGVAVTVLETTVVALYIHGDRSSQPEDTKPTPMLSTHEVEAVEGKGLRQDLRYFRRGDPDRGRPRQVSLIDEGTIRRHEAVFGPIDRALVKSQVVLSGDLRMPDMLGATLAFEGGAEVTLSLPRKPCFAMDLIAPGLKEAMSDGNQGALARVTRTGVIRVGQRVFLRIPDELERNLRTVAV